MIDHKYGLTEDEKAILNSLADAWNRWCQLPDRSTAKDGEFCNVIHQAQAKIALRVARRVNPEIWR